MYKLLLVKELTGGTKQYVLSSDGWTIPPDPDNTHYQRYLAWLAEGNTPEPADEVTQ